MKTVMLPRGGERAYWSALKAQRKTIAAFYQDNPDATVSAVMQKFNVSRNTVNAALKEHGLTVDRLRNRIEHGIEYRQWKCDVCQQIHRCYHGLLDHSKPAMSPDDIDAAMTVIEARAALAEMSKPPRH